MDYLLVQDYRATAAVFHFSMTDELGNELPEAINRFKKPFQVWQFLHHTALAAQLLEQWHSNLEVWGWSPSQGCIKLHFFAQDCYIWWPVQDELWSPPRWSTGQGISLNLCCLVTAVCTWHWPKDWQYCVLKLGLSSSTSSTCMISWRSQVWIPIGGAHFYPWLLHKHNQWWREHFLSKPIIHSTTLPNSWFHAHGITTFQISQFQF